MGTWMWFEGIKGRDCQLMFQQAQRSEQQREWVWSLQRGSPSAFFDFGSEVERPCGSCILSQTEGKENLGTDFFFLLKFWNNMLMLAQVPHPLLLCKDIG